MQRYDTYKDSGVQWLGEIPSHWEVKRLKNVVSYNDDVLLETEKKDKHIKYVEISDVDSVSGIKQYSEYDFKDAPSRARRVTRKGDVIVSTVRTYLRAVAQINDDDLIVSTGFAVLRAKKIDKRFLAYYILSDSFISEVIRRSVGTNYPAINANELVSIYLICPPNNEQTAIANYLDTATAKIDAAIAQQQKMIDLLNERKQIIINRAVTKGLNPNAKMKDSGVEWIGEVPEGWEMRRLKTFLSIKDKRNQDEYATLLSVYTSIGVRPRAELEEKGNKASTVMNYKIVNKGDLIVNRLLAWMGAYGLSNYDGVTSPDYDVYSFKKGYCKEFYEILFRNTNFKSDCYKYGHGIMMMRWRTYPNEFLNILVPVPPKEEQEKLLESLKPQIKKIDAGVDKCSQIISLLQERKQIIINEVVTGKVKVV